MEIFDLALWKESLDSDVQQLHQYQQNGQPSLTSNHAPQNRTTNQHDMGNPGAGLGQTQNRGGIKQVNGAHMSDLRN